MQEDTADFAPMKARTLKGDIADLITQAILSGKIKPRERLNESQLARSLQVSRAPIREALQILQEQGLLLNHPRRGMFVVCLDPEEQQKINSLRLVLESEALRLVRQNLNVAGEKRLVQLVERMEALPGAPAIQSIRLDLDFHRTIWAMSGNEYLEKMLTSLTAPLFAYALVTLPKEEQMRMILDSHRPLLEYVQGRSKRCAEEVVLEHIGLRWDQPARFWSQDAACVPAS
jgi:DNA-binding GntR family transcriptional regulator